MKATTICTNALLLLCFLSPFTQAQVFTRSELPTLLTTPWEITYGPDNFLYITEAGGKVVRVEPTSGDKQTIYTAPDYFPGSPLEQSPLCIKPNIGIGTLGLALHPDFNNSATAYIYFVYSYNSGSASAPATRFKIKRLLWNATTASVVADTDIVTMITSGYDHLGGRLMAIKQNNVPYLFLTVGDHGISEVNYPTCYSPQSSNPNNLAQDPTTQNGKVHRFNIDGSVPADNPITGNSFYTRGHRNPQGLAYNYNLNVLYDIEHGDRTDDEINVLYKGMNYGWKFVRGYHNDNNYPGEAEFITNYKPDARIEHDSLVEPLYSFCAASQDTSSNGDNWCTTAPSDGIYYGSKGIAEWTNSILLVTLKDGVTTDMEVYQLKLTEDGKVVPSIAGNPNPKRFFGSDQKLNGRLRDIAVSPDGKTIYLINNGGANRDKISVYTYNAPSAITDNTTESSILLYPNPATNICTLQYELPCTVSPHLSISTLLGSEVLCLQQGIQNAGSNTLRIETGSLPEGMYNIRLELGAITINRRLVIAR